MKTLYKVRPNKFRDIWFTNNTALKLEHYFGDSQWYYNAHLEVYYDNQIDTIYYKITSYRDNKIILQDSFIYSSEEEALNWLFDSLEAFGHANKNYDNKETVFNIPFTLYHYLGGNYGDYGTREIVVNFFNYYRQHGTNLVILMEITSLGKIDPTTAPKVMTEKLMKKAPHLARIITDFFVDRSLNDNRILTYFAEKTSY